MLKKVYATQNADPEQLERLRMLRVMLNISEEMHQKLEGEIKNSFYSPEAVDSISPRGFNVLVNESAYAPKSPANVEMMNDLKIKKYITLGKEKYQKKEYSEALELFTKGLELAPGNEEFHFLIKKVTLKLKENGEDDNNLQEEETSDNEIETNKAEEVINNKESNTSGSESELVKRPKIAIPVDTFNGASIRTEPMDSQPGLDQSESEEVSKPKQLPENDISPIEPDNGSSDTIDPQSCISCNGTGNCYWCNGSGKCDRCGGSGTFNDKTCSMCNGSGKCNSCLGEGLCMWCRGKGKSVRKMNTIYSKND
jgi:hypothetical protein